MKQKSNNEDKDERIIYGQKHNIIFFSKASLMNCLYCEKPKNERERREKETENKNKMKIVCLNIT